MRRTAGRYRRSDTVAIMTVVLWLLVAPLSGWAAVRLFGLERGWVAVCAMAFTPYAAAASVVPLAIAVLARQWWPAGMAAAAAGVLCAAVLPRAVGRKEQGQGPVVRVLTANLLHGEADAEKILSLVREKQVDILAMQEYTPLAQKKLAAAGLPALLPHRTVDPLWEGIGSALYTRLPLDPEPSRINPDGYRNTRGTVRVPGGPEVLVESAHPSAPWSPYAMGAYVAGQANQPPATPDGPLRILLGDFNATLDHVTLRRLIRTGYRDAAGVVGRGLRTTWSGDRVRLPGVTLDHVLADRRIKVRAAEVHHLPASDHNAVYAELILPTEG